MVWSRRRRSQWRCTIAAEPSEDSEVGARSWVNRQVLAIAFSAFFADLGYQAVVAGLPLLLVIDLHAGVVTFATATAIGYGGGAVASLIGGRLGDRYGHRRVSIAGNAFIPLLSLVGLVNVAWAAVAFFVAGWWARNLRSPPRRALLVRSVPSPGDTGRAFGLLHGLDVGGGMIAALAAAALLGAGWSLPSVFLLTAVPLAVSTLVLACLVVEHPLPTTPRAAREPTQLAETIPVQAAQQAMEVQAEAIQVQAAQQAAEEQPTWENPPPPPARRTRAGVLVASALFGFSFYSVGFPVLTVSQHSHSMVSGILVFALFSGVSGAVGFAVGARRWDAVMTLGVGGFGLSALASLAFGMAAYENAGLAPLAVAAAVLGAGLGVMETIEPTLIAALTPSHRHGAGMGNLAAARSIGLFVGNMVMGVLYVQGVLYAYAYAAGAALLGSIVMFALGRGAGITIASGTTRKRKP